MKPPLGVILAGGQATRMGGGDKGLLRIGGDTLMGHVIARLDPQVADLAINANGDPGSTYPTSNHQENPMPRSLVSAGNGSFAGARRELEALSLV